MQVQPTRVPTTWVLLFDGTWADRASGNRNTVVSTIQRCINRAAGNVHFKYYQGVGTADAYLDRYIGGGTGRGVRTNVIRAFGDLVDNYRDGDTIIFVGYSRGSTTARALACLIGRIGIPDTDTIEGRGQDPDEICRELYKKYAKGQLRKQRIADYLKRKYNSHRDVRIAAVCCFDTVMSMGMPTTGLFSVLRPFRKFYNRHKYLEVHPDRVVEHLIHAICLQEVRAAYDVELMRIRQTDSTVLKQVYFVGNHTDLGWEKEYGGLVDIPLAWMLQQLHDHAGLEYKTEELEKRFPAFKDPPQPMANENVTAMVSERVQRCNLALQILTGWKKRVPGSSFEDRYVTQEQIHQTVRLRNYGASKGHAAVPKHALEEKPDGCFCWVRNRQGNYRTGSDLSMERQSIPEAVLGRLEARLLGIQPNSADGEGLTGSG